jgi:hypothetical protein
MIVQMKCLPGEMPEGGVYIGNGVGGILEVRNEIQGKID